MTYISPHRNREVASRDSSTAAPIPIQAIPTRKYGQWIAAVVVAVFSAQFFLTLAGNEQLDYGAFLEYLTNETVMKGIVVTFQLMVASAILGSAIGMIVAIAKLSNNRFLRTMGTLYTWFFRSVPLLAGVLIFGNFAILFSRIGISVPFTNIQLISVDTNSVMTVFVAGWLALSVHEGAYMAEIIRGGIIGVPFGQREAAQALGMTNSLMMRRIILPQSLRAIVPPMGNRIIILTKESSLVSVIAGGELMNSVLNLSATNYLVIEMLMVATFWYLIIVSALSLVQRRVERRLSQGYVR